MQSGKQIFSLLASRSHNSKFGFYSPKNGKYIVHSANTVFLVL